LVQAGPGTGKTEIVARRLNHLLQSQRLRPGEILILCFSRSAVKALNQRVANLKAVDNECIEDLRYLSIRTFDSWTFRMLRFLGATPNDLLKKSYEDNIRQLTKKLSEHTIDELVSSGANNLQNFKHIIIDEYQDLTGVRAKLVQVLLSKIVSPGSRRKCGFTVLGDPCQAIYGWMANGDNRQNMSSQELIQWLQEFFKESLSVQTLNINHRSTSEICNLVDQASKIIRDCQQNNLSPKKKLIELIGHRAECEDSEDVVRDIQNYNDNEGVLAVLCRNNSQIISLQNELKSKLNREEFKIVNVTSGNAPRNIPSWVASMLYMYKTETLSKNTFMKIVNQVAASNGRWAKDPESAWKILLRFCRQNDDDIYINMENLRDKVNWPDSLPDDEGESQSGVIITTIHQSKGLEFDRVKFLIGDNGRENVDVHEEGRVIFVAISRARKEISLLELPSSDYFCKRDFGGERQRWHAFRKYNYNYLEIGQECDLNHEGIIDSFIQGGIDKVTKTQQFLIENETTIKGSDVILAKTPMNEENNKFVYNIILKNSSQQIILGQTSQTLTKDILSLMKSKCHLPKQIKGLRIRSVTSIARNSLYSANIPAPWCESKIWLGVDVHGIGIFKLEG
jgi:superfamily I DNA/RNA helicase